MRRKSKFLHYLLKTAEGLATASPEENPSLSFHFSIFLLLTVLAANLPFMSRVQFLEVFARIKKMLGERTLLAVLILTVAAFPGGGAADRVAPD